MRSKVIDVCCYYWDADEDVVMMISAEVENKTSYLRPTFNTVEKALEEKHRVMMDVCKKYGVSPIVEVEKQVIKENEVDWS